MSRLRRTSEKTPRLNSRKAFGTSKFACLRVFAAFWANGRYAQIARFAKFGVTDCVGGVTGPNPTFVRGAGPDRYQTFADIRTWREI